MSGIYIKGMEMPKNGCATILIMSNGTVYRTCTLKEIGTAVPVPPHGRLIDADALEHDFKKLVYQDNWYYNSLHHTPHHHSGRGGKSQCMKNC